MSDFRFQIPKGSLLEKHPKLDLGLLILTFVVLGLIYTTSVPAFESPDEPWHFNYVRHVAAGNGLPSMRNNDSGAYQEVGQPPLYYLVAGLVTAPVPTDDLRSLMWHNPGFGYHAPGTVNDNKNLLVHTGRESFPWRDAVLALHLARLVSLVFGALAVLATWALAREVFPDLPLIATIAAALVALNPQFIFMSSVASNDSSAAALSTAALWAIARMWRRGVTLRRAALAGLLIGLASLTKTSTILLGLFAVAAILFWRLDRHSLTVKALFSRLPAVVVLVTVALGVGGWWYARNALLYGDPLGLGVHLDTPWARPAEISLANVLPSLPLIYRSFWAAFGWGNVELPAWVYVALGVVVLATVAGWIRLARFALGAYVARRDADENLPVEVPIGYESLGVLVICLLWCGAVGAALLRWNQQVEAPHGRLLFPMLGAFALLLASGLAWLPRPRLMMSAVAVGFLALALAAPLVAIQPAYAWPQLVPVERAGDGKLVYGDTARLVNVSVEPVSVAPGGWVNVKLCWTAERAMDRNYTLFVHLLGPENLVVGARTTWPGLGRFPTSLWPVGQAFCDTVPIQVEAWAPAPALYAVEAGLYDAAANDRLEAVDVSTGQLLAPPVLTRVRVVPAQPLRVSPQRAAAADFGVVRLIGYDMREQARPGQSLSVRLYWRAQNPVREDYTVFVHLVDASGRLAAQADSQPRGGTFTTSAWAAGDVIPDEHTLTLPADLAPGEYSIGVGLYRAPDGPRLPLAPAGDTFSLGTLRISDAQ